MQKHLFRTTLLFLVFLELLSIFAWRLPQFNLICFGVILFITLVLSIKKLAYGLYIAAVELIIGSQGHLFSLNLNHGAILISLRIGLFAAVMFAWAVYVLCNGGFIKYWQQLKSFIFFKYYLALAVVIIWGVIKNLLSKSTEKISLSSLSVNVEIIGASLEGQNILVNVRRNAGKGNLTGIKFIFSDGKNSERSEEHTSELQSH